MKAATSALRFTLLPALLLAAAPPSAIADSSSSPTEADVAFKKGRDLARAGKYAEACAQFERSETLDPQLGTQFNLAQCEEKLGKLAAALANYRDVADHDTNTERRSAAIDLAAQLDKRVPRLQLQLDPATAAATVKLGTSTVSCQRGRCDARVDRGHYDVVATAPGFRDATASVDVAGEGTTVIVKLVFVPATPATHEPAPPVATKPPEPAAEPARAPAEPPAHSHRKQLAIGALATGGAALATGVVFGVLANSAWSDAKAACNGTTSCATSLDLTTAQRLENTANSRANASTVFVLAGAALATAGVVLWVTAPSEHAISVAPAGPGVSITGAF